ncbi:MAG: hypothetical protein PHN38_09535 [Sulfurospirillaceae bacterium]|nr:hypothetical protein [Sulfurospirillaceae bacterium]MDD3463474.1 hypothetical protein [Sulfurospirillaceae bacterium]
MNFAEAWIEHDYNPFIVFDTSGKILSLNQEAQYLLGETSHKKIFDLAQTYANISYGFKTTILDIDFDTYKFYGITVGYQDENCIGIKLYKAPSKKFAKIEENGKKINIYTALDLCISASSTNGSIKFKKDFDPTLPELIINVEYFMKLLSKIYQSYSKSQTITTKLGLVTGEHIRYNKKKYPIFYISITGDLRDFMQEKYIEELAQKSNCIIQFNKTQTIISSALISQRKS